MTEIAKTPACKRRNTCRLCQSDNVELVLPLRSSALADSYIPKERLQFSQPKYPLDVFLCRDCGHVQLLDVVDPKILFSNYLYVTSVSLGLLEHFRKYAHEVLATITPSRDSLIIDIGSNEGALLKNLKTQGFRVLGVDSAQNIAAMANAAGIETIADFFSANVARSIRQHHGAASIVTANNVFAHSDALPDMVDGIRDLLAPDGVFVFEVIYLLDLVQNFTFDTIYHEHLCQHSVKPMQAFFQRHGLELFDVKRIPTKGGSIRGFVQRAGADRQVSKSINDLINLEEQVGLHKPELYRKFMAKLELLAGATRDLLKSLKASGKAIAGYGASATVTTLIHQFQLDEFLEFIVDDDPLRQGLFSPGLHIPVVSAKALADRKPDYVVILAWQYATPIIAKNQEYLKQGGHFVVPLPGLKII